MLHNHQSDNLQRNKNDLNVARPKQCLNEFPLRKWNG